MAHLTITESDRLQLIGLLSVGAQLLHQLNSVDQAMCKLLGEKPDYMGYSGHISDTLYEADTHNPIHLADGLLNRLHIEVVPEPAVAQAAEAQQQPASQRPLPIGFNHPPITEQPPF